jgi:hypothetical protein
MASVFVEYLTQPDQAGYKDGPLNIKAEGSYRTFTPKKRYGNRRVEEFSTEEGAMELVGRRGNIFGIATDLIGEQELDNIEAFLAEKIAPLIKRIEALEGKRAPKKKAQAKR